MYKYELINCQFECEELLCSFSNSLYRRSILLFLRLYKESSVPSTESDDDDADQIEVRFWLPFDSTDAHAITMHINGTFERGNLVNTNLTLDGSSISFRRGSDYTTRAYYLVAQTSYTFSLFGLATITELDQNLTSLTSDEYTFETRELIHHHI